MSGSRPLPVLVGAAVLACALAGAAALPDRAYDAVFCRGPALLAAAYFHAEVEGSSFVLGSGRVVAVTRACGGSDFFALALAVLAWHAVRRNVASRLPLWAAGAWAYTLLVNGFRVIATVWTRALAEGALPERLFAAAHLVSGVLTFFPALALLWWVCIRYDTCKRADAGKAGRAD